MDEDSLGSSPETSEISELHTDPEETPRRSSRSFSMPPPLQLDNVQATLKVERKPLIAEQDVLQQELPSTPIENKVTESEIKRVERDIQDFRDRIAAIMEILESERKYVVFLQLLWDMYYLPMTEGRDRFRKNSDPEKVPVSTELARKFFPPNLDAIMRFNHDFLQRLEDRFKIYINEPTGLYFMKVSDLFLVVLPYIKVSDENIMWLTD
jgi:hypothetical protein